MPVYLRAQVNIPQASNLAADAAQNTLYFRDPGDDVEVAADSAHDLITAFYTTFDQSIYSGATTLPAVTVKYYDLTDPEPRVPVFEAGFTITTGTGAGYPSEVAICLSFQGERESGVNQARRRGRIYLGPLDADVGTTSTGRVVVAPAAVTAITGAASTMATGLGQTAVWCVFSPTTAGPQPWSAGVLDVAFTPVTNGWVDNAFDTQRRRGTDSLVRTVWT